MVICFGYKFSPNMGVAKKEKLAHMLMGVIRAEVADCDVVDR